MQAVSPTECLIYRLLWFVDINSDKTRIQFGFLISHIEPCARIGHSALQFLSSRASAPLELQVLKWTPNNSPCSRGHHKSECKSLISQCCPSQIMWPQMNWMQMKYVPGLVGRVCLPVRVHTRTYARVNCISSLSFWWAASESLSSQQPKLGSPMFFLK